jgi:hypothetical protein
MLLVIFDLLCTLITFLLNSIINILFRLRYLCRQCYSSELSPYQRQRLQAERQALLVQRNCILHQITQLDELLQSGTSPSTSIVTPDIQTLPSNSSPSIPSSRNTLQRSTPPRRGVNNRQRSVRIGQPYPIPYTPPRTPEEERRNNVIAWLNVLRLQNQLKDGKSG